MNPHAPARDVYALGISFQQLMVGQDSTSDMKMRVKLQRVQDPIIRKFAQLCDSMVSIDADRRPTDHQIVTKIAELQSEIQQRQLREQIAVNQ